MFCNLCHQILKLSSQNTNAVRQEVHAVLADKSFTLVHLCSFSQCYQSSFINQPSLHTSQIVITFIPHLLILCKSWLSTRCFLLFLDYSLFSYTSTCTIFNIDLLFCSDLYNVRKTLYHLLAVYYHSLDSFKCDICGQSRVRP